MLGIEQQVRCAMDRAGLGQLPFYSLPFPACSHQEEYVQGLVAALDELGDQGILDLDC
jgi:hypothetical protein